MVTATAQAAMLAAALQSGGGSRTEQAAMLAATAADATSSKTSQAQMLVAFAPPGTRNVRTTEALMLAATAAAPSPAKVSSVAMLVAYRTGGEENLLNRSWSFVLDGHTFYAITLGEQGTFVYDQSTGEWSQFQTTGLTGWNMEIGTIWQGKVIAADQSNPIIWEMDPSSMLDDDFKPITRKATGGYPIRDRDQPSNFAFRITASVGQPEVPVTLPVTVPYVQLTYSDDQGKTFQDAGTIDLPVGNFTEVLQWLSLGSMMAPGRVYVITDVGGLVRLDGATSDIEGQ
jgi:hypothetical protein